VSAASPRRVLHFGAGPAALPLPVLEQAQRDLLDYAGSGIGILELSHRGAEYGALKERAEGTLRRLLGAGDDWAVLFLPGGASLQFAMVPLNLGAHADYVLTGSWAKKAWQEARKLGDAHVAATSEATHFDRIPRDLDLRPTAKYLHVTSNNTIYGTQWREMPEVPAPLVCDASSDLFSRPLSLERHDLIYAGAQKNLGPAGVTVVLLRRELLARSPDDIPTMLNYRVHEAHQSNYNTPPVFAVHVMGLVLAWIEAQGGLVAMAARNEAKAGRLYDAIDRIPLYQGTAVPADRSRMNVTFTLSDPGREDAFLAEARREGLVGLKGHRSVGGIRASLYNAVEPEAVERLVAFMEAFAARSG
jgi:phosphoserine aminotransferase